jgi:hypothetical protein
MGAVWGKGFKGRRMEASGSRSLPANDEKCNQSKEQKEGNQYPAADTVEDGLLFADLFVVIVIVAFTVEQMWLAECIKERDSAEENVEFMSRDGEKRVKLTPSRCEYPGS